WGRCKLVPYILGGHPSCRRSVQQRSHEGGRVVQGRNVRHQDNQCIKSYPSASELQNKQEISLLTQAAEHFRIAGEKHWYDSANAYALAAALYTEALKDSKMAAEIFTEAAIVMEKVDPDFAIEYYRKAISQHCAASQYNEAAMLEERISENHIRKANFEGSIDGYERATKLYTAAGMHDSADRTHERSAYLIGKTGRLRDAAYAYQKLAICQANHNLKKFNAPPTMLRAGVLLLSDCVQRSAERLHYSEMRQMMEEMYSLDCRFEQSREHAFLADVMQCVTRGDKDRFIDCLYSFNSLSEFDDLMLEALEGIKNKVVERTENRKDPK
ncbi:hypothetical protein ACHAXR_009476, partial [Thalassiosira sp. AJA248-18]